jgi:hypothetical protein
MALSLEQYILKLDERKDLIWPTPPDLVPAKARPHLIAMPNVRCVLWNVYGTLLNIRHGELRYDDDNSLIQNIALDKTIQEFKMWHSMSRKPGQPADYMRELYGRAYDDARLTSSTGEVPAEKPWENIVKKLLQKEYVIDAATYGSLNEFTKKIAYFYHEMLQGTRAYPNASFALRYTAEQRIQEGFLADGQCFTMGQVKRSFLREDLDAIPEIWISPGLRFLSSEVKAKKPSDPMLRNALQQLKQFGIQPEEVLHVGSSLTRDLGPAKKLGMRTALFAGDRNSIQATGDQLKDPNFRPDVLLTDLEQITQILG